MYYLVTPAFKARIRLVFHLFRFSFSQLIIAGVLLIHILLLMIATYFLHQLPRARRDYFKFAGRNDEASRGEQSLAHLCS
jgi:hypothetical protein